MVAMIGSVSPIVALAYWPIRKPAWKLSVANSASVASIGSVGVSSAITSTPCSRAASIAGTIPAVSPGVIRIPCAPAVTMFSMAVVWPALSASNAPAAVSSSAPAASAAACAPSFILTKKGLVSVLVISPTMISSSWASAGCREVNQRKRCHQQRQRQDGAENAGVAWPAGSEAAAHRSSPLHSNPRSGRSPKRSLWVDRAIIKSRPTAVNTQRTEWSDQDAAGAPRNLSSASTKKYSPHITLSSTPRSMRSW